MEDRKKLLCKLSAVQFAAWELHMFLDTHPRNREAFEKYEKYTQEAIELKKMYEEKFGPLSTPGFDNGHWNWTDSPWPWDVMKEGE